MRRHVASTFATLVLGGLVASGSLALAQQQPEQGQDEANARETQRDAQEQTQQQREERQRQQQERQQADQRQQESANQQQDERARDRQLPDNRARDQQRFQDRRFQDQAQDRGFQEPGDRQAFDDRRTRRPQSEEQGAWLGVYLTESPQQQGALVRSVYPTGPAARAGFRGGDVIVAINGQRITEPQQAIDVIDRLLPRSQAEFVVQRNNQEVTLTATLGDRQAFMGPQLSQNFGEGFAQRFEDDELANIPPYLMELEHNRRMAEQHQRIEEMIERLHQEVRQLREELRNSRR